ncbi:MAG: hypothetical protein FJX76_27145 [Armatimonadetes bacterium]|nr:hypothetical protein [Armatimonadota bacterium]
MTAAGSNVSLAGQKVTKVIGDGTSGGQSWNINFGFMKNNAQPPQVDNPVEPGNGLVGGAKTTQVTFHSHLNSTTDAGNIYIGPTTSIVDRVGTRHDVSFVFTKTIDQTGSSEAADTWMMHMTDVGAGGAWTGASENTSGILLEFDSSGTLVKTNGENGRLLEVTFADGTAEGQKVVVDMSSLSSTPAASSVTLSADGASPGTTLSAYYTATLDRDELSGYSTTIAADTFLDYGGLPHPTSLTMTKTGRNTWSYQINGLTTVSDHWNGIRSGGANAQRHHGLQRPGQHDHAQWQSGCSLQHHHRGWHGARPGDHLRLWQHHPADQRHRQPGARQPDRHE